MESEPIKNPIAKACVGDCKGHDVDVPNWTQVTVVGSCDTARANVYQVAVAGVGGTATYKDGAHGVVAVASHYGNASTGNGGVAISNGGLAHADAWAIAHAKGGKAVADACGVAVTAGGYASAGQNGIGIGWFSNHTVAIVEAGPGGVAIGDTGCLVRVGIGGVLIAMADPKLGRATKICREGKCKGEIMAEKWYEIMLDTNGQFKFQLVEPPPEWKPTTAQCPKPPKA